MDNYKGYSLFNDQEEPLRSRNRAVVMANMIEDNMDKKTKRINPLGMALSIGYMNVIPQEERKELAAKFAATMKERGFAIVEPKE